jgi:hypothetical protein
VNAKGPLTEAIGEWQRKHHIADGDPMIAALELVRIYLQQVRKIDDSSDAAPSNFEDFRSTIELLDRRSRALVQQATDLIGELLVPPSREARIDSREASSMWQHGWHSQCDGGKFRNFCAVKAKRRLPSDARRRLKLTQFGRDA